ncbi:hypothetical protein ACQKNX_07790 [Lysinibacillus sp. NPDC093712]|uniref:hypothetical protein n=1 Tax=Lysinibacillus sp. NPDC093712 TaxID=3390579 RepID=UPI003CFC81BB
MAYGLFRDDKHIYTYECKSVAEKQAKSLGYGFYVRWLTFDEYHKRMKEIYVEGKYN